MRVIMEQKRLYEIDPSNQDSLTTLKPIRLPDPSLRLPEVAHVLSDESMAARERFLAQQYMYQAVLDVVVETIGNRLGTIHTLELMDELRIKYPEYDERKFVTVIYETLNNHFIVILPNGLIVHPLLA